MAIVILCLDGYYQLGSFNATLSQAHARILLLPDIVTFSQKYFMLSKVHTDRGWSGGAKVLDKLPGPGRPTNLDNSRARAYCACKRCGWGLFGHFFSHLSLLFSFSLSLWETARYRLKYRLKGPLNPEQPTNQIILIRVVHVYPKVLKYWDT